jgi:hypothetical protein
VIREDKATFSQSPPAASLSLTLGPALVLYQWMDEPSTKDTREVCRCSRQPAIATSLPLPPRP